MSVVIPIGPDFRDTNMQPATLDGVTYTLRWQWSTREACWYVSLATEDGDPIWTGVKLVIGWPLGWRYKDPRAPKGLLIAIDTSGKDDPPGEADIGGRVQLTYATYAEAKAKGILP